MITPTVCSFAESVLEASIMPTRLCTFRASIASLPSGRHLLFETHAAVGDRLPSMRSSFGAAPLLAVSCWLDSCWLWRIVSRDCAGVRSLSAPQCKLELLKACLVCGIPRRETEARTFTLFGERGESRTRSIVEWHSSSRPDDLLDSLSLERAGM